MEPGALTSTYRLQLNASFRLPAARAIVPYLERLGISHVYSSPLLAARPGSQHGYDVVDPTRLNPELGSDSELRELATGLHQRGMGILLDIVPNHMGTGTDNPFWEDLLANGRGSRWAHWFDVDWESERASLRGRVLIPVLRDTLEAVLRRRELSLVRDEDRIRLKYADQTFPLSPETEAALRRTELAAWQRGREGHARLRELLEAQHYRLAFWRRASVAINYRRFFDVAELIALRMHDASVFGETHALLLHWVEDRVIDGLRVDHIDGLLDPQGYLDGLRVELTQRRPTEGEQVPIVVEKILSAGERLRESWPVQGTTGYEFLNDVEALLIDPAGAERLEDGYRRLVGARARGGLAEAAVRGKELVLRTTLAADVARLTRLLQRALTRRKKRGSRGTAAIRRFIAALPVYRTYIDGRGPVHDDDRRMIERAIARVRDWWGRGVELARLAAVLTSASDEDALRFVTRLQQTSGAATAKGVEDTALYRHVSLASRNEVGADPSRDLLHAARDLHAANGARQKRWPRSLLCTSTHDTKRSADVRARLDVLSEMPDEWMRAVRGWRRLLARRRVSTRRGTAPDAATEWLLFQSMLGIWPLDDSEPSTVRDRILEYMRKATREAKVRTSWTSPDEAFERALESYVDAALGNEQFTAEMGAFASGVAPAGFCNALARLLVHLTAPGTPDIYQGDEMWNFALVDPDNRRPVDFEVRRAALDRIDASLARGNAAAACAEMLGCIRDGRLKLHVTRCALRLRRATPDPFLNGTYTALSARGEKRRHTFGFMRRSGVDSIVTAVTRLPVSLGGPASIPTGLAWEDTEIIFPHGDVPHRWRCALTDLTVETQRANGGSALLAREVFRTLPIALLVAA